MDRSTEFDNDEMSQKFLHLTLFNQLYNNKIMVYTSNSMRTNMKFTKITKNQNKHAKVSPCGFYIIQKVKKKSAYIKYFKHKI